MENLERRDSSSSMPTLEISAGIYKAIQAEALLFLPTDEAADYNRIGLRMTLGDFLNFQRLTMHFAKVMGGNYDQNVPIARSYLSEEEWNNFYEDQLSANTELSVLAGSAISQATSSINRKEDFFNLEEREIETRVKVKTAKSLVKAAIASMFEVGLLGQKLPEHTLRQKKDKFGYVRTAEHYFERYVQILTQLSIQGIPINFEKLSDYQEKVNHLSPLIEQADTLLKGQE